MTKIHLSKIVQIIGVVFLLLFAVGYFIVLFYILTSIIHTAFPTWISGQTETTPNYVRNSLELVYFMANSAVALIAIYAIRFAKQQSKEAENARLASIYTTIEARWASSDMRTSREYFRSLMKDYRNSGKPFDEGEYSTFVAKRLHDDSNTDPSKYMQAMSIVDFVEYLGMLETKNYLKIDGPGANNWGSCNSMRKCCWASHPRTERRLSETSAKPEPYEGARRLSTIYRTRAKIQSPVLRIAPGLV